MKWFTLHVSDRFPGHWRTHAAISLILYRSVSAKHQLKRNLGIRNDPNKFSRVLVYLKNLEYQKF